MNYDIQRCTRHCAASGRELLPGEAFYSVLLRQGAEILRQDYAADAWQGPPADVLGWWKSHVPAPESKKKQWAPNDVMLELFDQLENQPDRRDLRYVLALLLVRRRVMRVEETGPEPQDGDTLVLHCPRRDAEFQVQVCTPNEERADELQQELMALLSAGSE